MKTRLELTPESKEKKRIYDRNYQRNLSVEQKAKVAIRHKAWLRKKRYGVTDVQIKEMCSKQNGQCSICLKSFEDKFVVDHDHTTNKVRELLCSECNIGLGKFKEDITLLEKAKEYILKHRN